MGYGWSIRFFGATRRSAMQRPRPFHSIPLLQHLTFAHRNDPNGMSQGTQASDLGFFWVMQHFLALSKQQFSAKRLVQSQEYADPGRGENYENAERSACGLTRTGSGKRKQIRRQNHADRVN